jgi:molybdate transport system ATP-binding protein
MIDVDIEQQLGTFHLAVKFAAEAPIVGLFGRAGSGKSSVINAIAGISRPARGCIRINDVFLFDAARRIDLRPEERRIGYVFQDALLFPHMDVEANLLYGQKRRSPADRFIDEARVVDLLGLRTLLRRKPKALTGGEKQRVAIGRTTAQPRIPLMDGRARHTAKDGDSRLYRAAARRAQHPDRVREPFGYRDNSTRRHRRCAFRRQMSRGR